MNAIASRQAILRGYGLRDGVLEPVSARVSRLGGFALKLFDAADRRGARTEATILDHLNHKGERVPQLVRTALGHGVLELEDGDAVATRWQPGEQRRYGQIDDDTWWVLGKTLASLHGALDELSIDVPVLLDDVQRRDLARERAILLDHRTRVPEHAGLFADRLRLLDDHGTRAASPPVEPAAGICHNDYNEHNYLFVDGGPPMILDWERAIRAPREYEVVRCLNHLPLVAPVCAARFLAGYRTLRPLRAVWLAWAVDAALTAHAIKHWPIERWLRGEPDAAALLEGTTPVVHALAGHAAQLRAFFEAT